MNIDTDVRVVLDPYSKSTYTCGRVGYHRIIELLRDSGDINECEHVKSLRFEEDEIIIEFGEKK